jgi:hypothetical protein
MWNVLLAPLAPLREIRCRSLAAQPQSVVCVSLLSNVLVVNRACAVRILESRVL